MLHHACIQQRWQQSCARYSLPPIFLTILLLCHLNEIHRLIIVLSQVVFCSAYPLRLLFALLCFFVTELVPPRYFSASVTMFLFMHLAMRSVPFVFSSSFFSFSSSKPMIKSNENNNNNERARRGRDDNEKSTVIQLYTTNYTCLLMTV